MALVYTGTDGLFTDLGKLVKHFNLFKTDAGNLDSDRDEILATFQASDQNVAIDGLVSAYASWVAQYTSQRGILAGFALARLQDQTSVLDEIGAASTAQDEILARLIEKMNDDSASVASSMVSIGSVFADSGNVGGGVILTTNVLDGTTSPGSINGVPFASQVAYNGLATELCCATQQFSFRVTADSFHDGLVEGSEEIAWQGTPPDDPYGVGEEGAGFIATIQPVHASTADIVTNADFETFTDNVPDGWTLVSGVAGTNVLAASSADAAHGLAALLYQGNASATSIEIDQDIVATSIVARKRYCVTAKLKKSSATTGTLLIEFEGTGYTAGSSEKISQAVSGLGTSYQLYHYFITMPAIVPSDFRLVIRWSGGTPGSSEKVFIDDLGVGPVYYGGGIGVAAVRSTNPFILEDRYTVTAMNTEGKFQAFFRRVFGVQLPSSSSPTIPDYYDPAPTVTSVSPSSGPASGGTAVTITGTGFLSGASVTFGGALATSIVVTSATTITCSAPAGTGTADVVVINTDGQAGTATNVYTYIPAPTVASVSPSSGPDSGGTSVTVSGTGFISGASVTFGGITATSIAVISATTITCNTPTGSGTVDVVVTNTDGQSGTGSNDYTYDPAPTVTSVSPSSGPASGGTAVTISGTGFISGASVMFGTTLATSIVVTSATTITCNTPSGSGVVDVVVTNTDGQSGTDTSAYTYVPAPTVTSVSPSSGPAAGGTSITVSGTGFISGASVMIDASLAASVVITSATTITCITPPATLIGTVSVLVTNTDGQSGTAINAYTYVPAPTVTSVSPSSGSTTGGYSVTISGTGFSGASVTFGGTSATSVIETSATTLTCNTPAGTGTVDVVVTNADGQSGTDTNAYTYVPPPTTTSVSPSSGPASGGTAVTVSGTGFLSSASVTFGGTTATSIVVTNSTTITCNTPAGTGIADVVVTNTDGQSGTATSAYTYVPAPMVTSVSPSSGPTGGGTGVTITGTGFTSGATVMFGGTSASFVGFSSSTMLTCTVPAGTGTVDVVVTNPDGQSGTGASAYTYIPAPTVTSVSSSSGPSAGGAAITVSGTGFMSGASVTFGGALATSVVVTSATTITCNTPSGTGTVDVIVTNTDGQSGTNFSAYTYVPAPTVTSVSPSSGSSMGGDTVTITGTDFTSGASVTFGGVSATSVVVWSATQIICNTPAGTGTVDVVVTNPDGQSGTGASDFTYF